MNRAIPALGATVLAGLPAFAFAQTQVPAILQSAASASASASAPVAASSAQAAANTVPATMPPPVRLVSPSAPLDSKERHAVALARRWAGRAVMPHAGEDGFVRFLYGATLPTVVCAPLQVCDLALQPGEVVSAVNVGDKVRWNISPAISGSAAGQITHLIVKPYDAGLTSSMTIQTDRRTYAIKLVSTQRQWMPLVAFNYPDDMQNQWSGYRASVGFSASMSASMSGVGNPANLDFGYRISGDKPSWRPLRVYSDGARTYIQFAQQIAFGSAPTLVGLGDDGGWFSSPTQQQVNYRIFGDRYVVDKVLDRAELISGVGGSQTRVRITREGH